MFSSTTTWITSTRTTLVSQITQFNLIFSHLGQIILLQENSTKLVFLVANTHILFNMKRGEIKAGQIALLLATIDRYVQQLSKTNNFAGVLLCGDFNIDPFSPLYHFIRDGALQISQFARDLLAFDTNKRLTSNFPGSSFNVPIKVPLDPNTCKFLPDGGSKSKQTSIDMFNLLSLGCVLTVDALQHDQRFLSAYRHVTADMEVCFERILKHAIFCSARSIDSTHTTRMP